MVCRARGTGESLVENQQGRRHEANTRSHHQLSTPRHGCSVRAEPSCRIPSPSPGPSLLCGPSSCTWQWGMMSPPTNHRLLHLSAVAPTCQQVAGISAHSESGSLRVGKLTSSHLKESDSTSGQRETDFQ
ncbi:hypothetical protein L798_11560 [Zootermopsis nevadensis]|uniref:Uncharacterized protein n=1 Tax=Zootermopsis nevadensis TaxID=136037 RepID=A0A067RIP8_ZOONE|nr:hypothetical protein L798_11560 [Zootermopsis nevadensis]